MNSVLIIMIKKIYLVNSKTHPIKYKERIIFMLYYYVNSDKCYEMKIYENIKSDI